MGGIDAKYPELGMEIKGQFGTYKLVEKLEGEEMVRYFLLK